VLGSTSIGSAAAATGGVTGGVVMVAALATELAAAGNAVACALVFWVRTPDAGAASPSRLGGAAFSPPRPPGRVDADARGPAFAAPTPVD